MATTWGPWVRVHGTDRSYSVEGTITCKVLIPNQNPDSTGYCFSRFGGFFITGLSGYMEAQAYWGDIGEGGHARVLHLILRSRSTYQEVETTYEYEFVNPETGWAEGVTGPSEIVLPFRVFGYGYVCKRAFGTTLPEYLEGGAKRQHMHPKDDSLKDDLFRQPNAKDGIQVGPLTLEGPDAFPPADDTYVGTSLFQITGTFDAWTAGSYQYAHDVMEVTVPGLDCYGILGDAVGGLSGTQYTDQYYVSGSNTSLSFSCGSNVPLAKEGWGLTLASALPIKYSFVTDSAGFDFNDSEDSIDPVVHAGFYVDEYVGGVLKSKEVTYFLSELPSYVQAPNVPSSGALTITSGRNRSYRRVGHVYHAGETFQVTVDQRWALQNYLYPYTKYESEDGATLEDHDDNYMILACPGVDGKMGPGVNENGLPDGKPHVSFMTLVAKDVPFFPVALSKTVPTDPPSKRWVQNGDLAAVSQWESGQYLYWKLPSTLYDPDKPARTYGGSIELELQTRYWDRLALLKDQREGITRNWRWPLDLRRRSLNQVDNKWDPQYATDLFCWKDWGYMQFRVKKPKWMPLSLTLTLTYSTVTTEDPHYTCESWRIEEFEYERTTQTVQYTVNVPAGTGTLFTEDSPVHHDVDVVVDLLCPDDGTTPNLFIVDKVVLDGLYIPFCDHPDKPANYKEGGELRVYEENWTFIKDPGWDHTGRDARNETVAGKDMSPRTGFTVSHVETWNFQDDWEGLCIERDGVLTVMDLPGEPYKNEGSEKGLGYIEPLKHCPTSEAKGQIDYARLYYDLGLIAWSDGWESALNVARRDAYLKNFWKGRDNPEVLSAPYMFWYDNGKVDTVDRTTDSNKPYDMPAAVRVKSWRACPGYTYTICTTSLKKPRIRALLKVSDGTKRVTPWWLRQTAQNLFYVIWVKYSYQDKDEEPIADPEGLPQSGKWTFYKTGKVIDHLSDQAVWTSPSLPLGRTRFWNPDRGEQVAQQTDERLTEVYVQFWADDVWRKYDLNVAGDKAKMQACRSYRGDLDAGNQGGARLWVRNLGPMKAPVEGLSAVRMPEGDIAVVYPGELRWVGQRRRTVKDSVAIAYHKPKTRKHGLIRYKKGYTAPTAALMPNGKLAIIADDIDIVGKDVLLLHPKYSVVIEAMAALEGYAHVQCTKDTTRQALLVTAVRLSDSKLCLHRVTIDPATGTSTWTFISEIGANDKTPAPIIVLNTWTFYVFRVYNQTIIPTWSTDSGLTWTS